MPYYLNSVNIISYVRFLHLLPKILNTDLESGSETLKRWRSQDCYLTIKGLARLFGCPFIGFPPTVMPLKLKI